MLDLICFTAASKRGACDVELGGGMDQINFSAWEGRTEEHNGGLSCQLAEAARASFGQSQTRLKAGDPLPPLWHWFAFLPSTATQHLGQDGHPPLGDFLPPVGLERRMSAGGSLSFHAPLHIGEALHRTSKIRRVTEKSGAAGMMVFVTVDHEISGAAGVAIREQQDIVYLAIPDAYTPPRKLSAPAASDVCEQVDVSAPLLFRYSALTFNSHRIHYDLPYAQSVEHYPGLVMHGPLQATLLMGLATRHAGRAPDRFSFRGVHPVFAGDQVHICGVREEDQSVSLCTTVASTEGAYQGMQARAIWEDKT